MQSSGNTPPKFDACYIRTPVSQGVYNKFSSSLSASIALFVKHRLKKTVNPGRHEFVRLTLFSTRGYDPGDHGGLESFGVRGVRPNT